MTFKLPDLPYALDALAPHMSRETLEYHHGRHHKAYVDKTNKLVAGTEFEKLSLDEILRKASGALFNNAAQAWNHEFFWNCLTPNAKPPPDSLQSALGKSFGGVEEFKDRFTQSAIGLFGSGWTWLAMSAEGKLLVVPAQNAGNPMTEGHIPLLACDVWEHAYYLDYHNARPAYLDHFWQVVNWDFVEKNRQRARALLVRTEEPKAVG